MTNCPDSLKPFFPKGVTAGKRSILFMSLRYNVSARARSIRNTNSATRYPSYVSVTGIILGAMSFRNEYDGHTMESSLEQVERLTGRKIKLLAGDRGYRGRKEINGTKIMIPGVPGKSDSRYQKLRKHKLFCKRAGIEPTIGHLKSDYRLGRNFYKGVAGDAVNVLLAAAAYNFKRAMKALWCMLQKIREILCQNNISQKWAF